MVNSLDIYNSLIYISLSTIGIFTIQQLINNATEFYRNKREERKNKYITKEESSNVVITLQNIIGNNSIYDEEIFKKVAIYIAYTFSRLFNTRLYCVYKDNNLKNANNYIDNYIVVWIYKDINIATSQKLPHFKPSHFICLSFQPIL